MSQKIRIKLKSYDIGYLLIII